MERKKQRSFDFAIRLPESKKYLRSNLVKIAEQNGLSLNHLVVYIFDWFLEERKNKKFSISLK